MKLKRTTICFTLGGLLLLGYPIWFFGVAFGLTSLENADLFNIMWNVMLIAGLVYPLVWIGCLATYLILKRKRGLYAYLPLGYALLIGIMYLFLAVL